MILRTTTYLCGGLVFSGLVSCGSVKSFKHKRSADNGGTAAPAVASTGDANQGGGPAINLNLTASYQTRPVDLLIVRDGDSHGQPMDSRIKAALPVLSARLWNLTASVSTLHVAVLDHYFDAYNQDPKNPQIKTATPIKDPKKPDLVLAAENIPAAEFSAAILSRVSIAGSRGGSARPASVLKAAFDEARLPNGGDMGGLMRPEAFWSVLYIGSELNPDDPLDQSDVAALLKDHAAGYRISALTIDKAGCSFAGVDRPQQANSKNQPQRNLEAKMQEMTGGVFGSVCAETYSLFMDDFVKQGTGTQYFSVDLPTPLQASSIKIFSAQGAPVKEFSYVPGAKQIQVSTLIASGQSFVIRANADLSVDPIVSTDPGDPGVPTALPR